MDETLTSAGPNRFAGFWRRSGALLLDWILLSAVGFLLGSFLHTDLITLGSWGRLIGLVIAVGYFGAANSVDFGGRTLGKRLLGLRVYGRDGQLLSVRDSLFRATILCAPFFLNGLPLHSQGLPSGATLALSVAQYTVVLGLGLTIVYLFLFNRPTRRSLHDLVVGSYVALSHSQGETPALGALARRHRIVAMTIIASTAVFPIAMMGMTDREPFSSLASLVESLEGVEGVSGASVEYGSTVKATVGGDSERQTYVMLLGTLVPSDRSPDQIADELVGVLLQQYAEAMSRDLISVRFIVGYDLGIYRSWSQQTFSSPPGVWVERLGIPM